MTAPAATRPEYDADGHRMRVPKHRIPPRDVIDFELQTAAVHMRMARHRAKQIGDEALMQSIDAVSLQISDLQRYSRGEDRP